MISCKKELKEYLRVEKLLYIDRLFGGKSSGIRKCTEWKYSEALRHCEYYHNCFKRHTLGGVYWGLKLKILSILTNVKIPLNCFEKGLLIQHCQNIVVSDKAKIGEWCYLFHNVTIGISLGRNDHGEAPQIGSAVTICTGAGIFGNIRIANKCVIGANAVVNKSFDDEGYIIAGVPAKKICPNSGFSMDNFRKRAVQRI